MKLSQIINLMDQDTGKLSSDEVSIIAKVLLSSLLDSSPLSTEDDDCREVFGEYDWKPKDGVDLDRFEQLRNQGIEERLSDQELDEFMEMVSAAGETHVYHTIYLGNKLASNFDIQEG